MGISNTTTLQKRSSISFFLPLAMLLLFTFSMTPKRWLHDLFAKHTDSYGYAAGNDEAAVSGEHINCHCDNIVVDTPFTFSEIIVPLPQTATYPVFVVALQEKISCSRPVSSSLRGPPAVI